MNTQSVYVCVSVWSAAVFLRVSNDLTTQHGVVWESDMAMKRDYGLWI